MEYIVAIVAISCATGLIKKWMDRNPSSEVDQESFNRLARAFMEYKKEMTERVENLEAIVTDEDLSSNTNFQQVESPSSNSQLTNDLNQKDRVHS
ncbi:MAG: hypothetical protein U5J63_04370 [Fodinibius sp.]|nr:hypothetical protein [Fodinibius sp.]